MTHAHRNRFVIGGVLLIAFILTWWVFIQLYRAQQPGLIVMPDGRAVTVEVADTDYLRAQGLSAQEVLGMESGMLFLHEKKERQTYWMKDMDMAIDIIWLDGDRIVGIEEFVEPESVANTADLTRYTSPQPVDRVLEGIAGFARHYDLERGDRLDISVQ
jgi:uncharacterized membrane protein (UPF0127 family)